MKSWHLPPSSSVLSTPASSSYRRRMSDSQARTQEGRRKLALADLRSVKWLASQPLVRGVYLIAKPRYLTLKQAAILGWFIVLNEMLVVWWWTFLHYLPWPKPALSLLDWTDSVTLRVMDYTQQRLEWWWDAWGVRFMRFRQALTGSLDKYVTIADVYLLRLQDILASSFTLLITPVRIVAYQFVYIKQQRTRSRPRGEAKEDSLQRGADLEGERYEDEDTEDWAEDYQSDTSNDSKRIMKTDSQGVPCTTLRATATAEGRLREAMYHRVKKELRLMRKNSIRISCGIVNYGRQMVEPLMLPYVESFRVYCQKWARDHDIQELMMPLQEVWNSERRPLAKALPLVRALFVVYLAFLLRLVKGKKNRRTRSMRSESLRRRAQNLTTSPVSLSPSALQQSSEPTPHQRAVQGSLLHPAQRGDEEVLDASQPKDSALGSEANHSDSEHQISAIDEGMESEEELNEVTPEAHSVAKDSGFSDAKTEDEDSVTRLPKKEEEEEVAKSPFNRPLGKKGHKFRGKKIVTISR